MRFRKKVAFHTYDINKNFYEIKRNPSTMRRKFITFFLLAISVFNLAPAFSKEVFIPEQKRIEGKSTTTEKMQAIREIEEEIRWLQAEAVITIATKHVTSISSAPDNVIKVTAN